MYLKLGGFWALRLMSVLLRIAGVVSILFSCRDIAANSTAYTAAIAYQHNYLLLLQLGGNTLLVAVGLYASGQLINLLLSIEQSLRVLRVLATKANRVE